MRNNIKKPDLAPYIEIFLLVLISSCFMFNFYMCLSGFVANKFAEPMVMLPIIISFFVPVLGSLVAIYHAFVGKRSRVGRIVSSAIMALLSFVAIVLVMIHIPLYVRNNALGAYSSTLGMYLFPYDTIVANLVVIAVSVIGIISAIKGEGDTRVENFSSNRFKLKLCLAEYIPFSILAIVVFVFAGAGLSGIGSIANALYDVRYLFLLVWVGIIPILDLAVIVIKPEKLALPKWCRMVILAAVLSFNIAVFVLLLIFEKATPGFVIQVGKPLFMIAFSVSLPIEMLVLLGIMALTVVMILCKILIMCLSKKESLSLKNGDKCASV